jgi:serine/threonine-protein kinase
MTNDPSAERVAAALDLTVVTKLGQGGMGEVHLVRRERNHDQFALKTIVAAERAEPGARALFRREMMNARALVHRNVVRTFDAGEMEDIPWLLMEFCDGGNLHHLVETEGPVRPERALGLILGVLAGLEYAHRVELTGPEGMVVGLVHRDLKPQNVFLADSSRTAKIGDFGLAKAFDLAGLSGLTRTGTVAGTPAFMPRQQVLNFKYSRPDVDVWATAATLYYLLTGVPPRDIPPGRDPWAAVWKSDSVPILKRGSAIPPRLAEAIDAALVDDPEIPFKSAAELRAALEATS